MVAITSERRQFVVSAYYDYRTTAWTFSCVFYTFVVHFHTLVKCVFIINAFSYKSSAVAEMGDHRCFNYYQLLLGVDHTLQNTKYWYCS